MPNLTLARKRAVTTSLASFEVLVRKVRETILIGQQRIEQEKVRTYWKAGQFINRHILLNKNKRADLGDHTIEKLAERVGVDQSVLQRCKQFAEKYPVLATWQKLTWSHFRVLITISDDKTRFELTQRANRAGWTTDKLESIVRAELRYDAKDGAAKRIGKSADDSGYELLTSKLGILYAYRLKHTPADGLLKIDQGFSFYKKEWQGSAKLKEGDIIESRKTKAGTYTAVKSDRDEEALFTYKAAVERVVDGDTQFVEIDLGFTNTARQYLRLRGIDAPELSTPAGKKAKAFVESLLKGVPFIFLTSTRSDKYDRYLADVFIPEKKFLKEWQKGTAVLNESSGLLFLNNELLRRGLAVRMR